jgi:heme oxygenase
VLDEQTGCAGPETRDVGYARRVLRHETKAEHLRLHALEPFAGLAAAALDLRAYAELLARLYTFHAGFEATATGALSRFPGSFPNHEASPRAALLAGDLQHLGVDPGVFRPIRLRQPRSAAEFAGMLYVVEGSVIGGAVLEAPAVRIAGLEASGYWRWCRVNGPRRWSAFSHRLEAIVDREASDRAAVAGARDTFRAFGAVFGAEVAAEVPA